PQPGHGKRSHAGREVVRRRPTPRTARRLGGSSRPDRSGPEEETRRNPRGICPARVSVLDRAQRSARAIRCWRLPRRKATRRRGWSASAARANAMLQELSAVSKDAATELQAGIPEPPPVDEIFSGAHFGVPDWDAGARRLETAPVDMSRWTKDLNL